MSIERKMLDSGCEIVSQEQRLTLLRTGQVIAQAVPVPVTPKAPNETRWVVRSFISCPYPKSAGKQQGLLPAYALGADQHTLQVAINRTKAEEMLTLLPTPNLQNNDSI